MVNIKESLIDMENGLGLKFVYCGYKLREWDRWYSKGNGWTVLRKD